MAVQDDTVVLVPTWFADSADGRHRRRVWQYVSAQWQRMGMTVIEGHDRLAGVTPLGGQPVSFSVARAFNDAIEHARGYEPEYVLMFGADHVPDANVINYAHTVLMAAQHLDGPGQWLRLFDRVTYVTPETTEYVLSGRVLPGDVTGTSVPVPCPGVLALDWTAVEQSGGFDPRYEGWGFEDDDYLRRLQRRVRPGAAGNACPWSLRELWHDGAHRDLDRNRALFEGGAG
jgi:hypothetical protein